MHVIATVNRTKVEVQVRTQLQDLWAQWAEKVGDVLGRQTRYGGPPNQHPLAPVNKIAQNMVDELRGRVASLVAEAERMQRDFVALELHHDTRRQFAAHVRDVENVMATWMRTAEGIANL